MRNSVSRITSLIVKFVGVEWCLFPTSLASLIPLTSGLMSGWGGGHPVMSRLLDTVMGILSPYVLCLRWEGGGHSMINWLLNRATLNPFPLLWKITVENTDHITLRGYMIWIVTCQLNSDLYPSSFINVETNYVKLHCS